MATELTAAKAADAPKLDADAWINAAIEVLAANGVEAIRVERLARQLNVTKGSFYWHFKDRTELLDQVLDAWRSRSALNVIQRMKQAGEAPKLTIRKLVELPFASSRSAEGASVEWAIRLWAVRDKSAAAAVQEVDRLRIAYLEALLEADGAGAEAPIRAYVIYSFIFGESLIRDGELSRKRAQDFLLKMTSDYLST